MSEPTDENPPSKRTRPATKPRAEGARAGRAAIVGRPNAGKSTLLNALVGQKLVIATPLPGTTRTSVLAVYTSDDPPTQIAFIDTPGLHRPKSALGSVLVDQARQGLADADVVILVASVPEPRTMERGVASLRIPTVGDEDILALVRELEVPVILALNKIDRLKDKRLLLPILQRYQAAFPFAAIVPISALRKTQLEGLVHEVRERLPEGLLYEADFFTDRPERFFVAELIREAAMTQTRQEVPHGVAVAIDQYIDNPELIRITATLIVEKDSHKAIVIGARGTRVRDIGTAARHAIEAFLERKVYLELHVRADEGWTSDPNRARKRVTETESP